MEQLANNASTTLNGSIDNSTTSITVNSNSTFPSSAEYRILIDNEIMIVTAGAGTNSWTVTRGAESTVAAEHADDAVVKHILTAGGLEQFVEDKVEAGFPSQTSNDGKFLTTDGSTLSWNYAIPLADVPPATPGLYDEEFNGTLNTLPTDWAWTSAPSGSDAWYVNRPSLPSCLVVYGDGNASYELTRSNFTASGDFGIWAKIFNGPAISGTACDFRIYLYDSTKQEGRAMEAFPSGDRSPTIRALKKISNSESAWTSAYPVDVDHMVYYFGLTRTSGNVWRGWASSNGIGYQCIGTAETHSFTLSQIVFTMNTANIKTLSGIDWVRYRSDLDFPIF